MKFSAIRLADGTILDLQDVLERAGIADEEVSFYTGFKDLHDQPIFDGDTLKALQPSVPGILDTVAPETKCVVTWDIKRGCWSVQYMDQGNVIVVPIPGRLLSEDVDGVKLEVELV